MNRQTLEDIPVKGKRVLVRVDFNVPLDAEGAVADDTRIRKTLPTIHYLIDRHARVVLLSHLGRPKGKIAPKYSLKPVAERLETLLTKPIAFAADCIGETARQVVDRLKGGEVALLENVRFHAEEEKNDPAFSKSLAALGDLFVNDAFGAAHRAHSSTAGIAEHLPAVAGFLLAKEIEYFDRVLTDPARPFVAILGGAKVVDKIKVIENLMGKVDTLLIGGAMAYTFLKAQGRKIGKSRFDEAGFETAKQILVKAKTRKVQLVFPLDHVIASEVSEGARVKDSDVDIQEDWIGVDIGKKTIAAYRSILAQAKTVVWNGPLGVFELKPFSNGTRKVAELLASLEGVTTVIGGGETAQAVAALGLENKMSHVSTGGGASLEYLEGKVLPGVSVLGKKQGAKATS